MCKQQIAPKTCPKCGSGDYAFRSRKTAPAEPGPGGGEVMETKYRCKVCGHEFRVRPPVGG